MKKFTPLFTLLMLFVLGAAAQNVPNRGFENWETVELAENPWNWTTSNPNLFFSGVDTANVVRSTDAFTGSNALRMQTIEVAGDTVSGYAISAGSISGDSSLAYIDGFPFTGQPDSLGGWFKYNLMPGDTALVLAVFKKNGAVIGENFFGISGTQNTWTQMSWELSTLGQAPDTALVAFTSGNPDGGSTPGGWVMVDGIYFAGTPLPDTIPNFSFEYWEAESFDEPEGWTSSNLLNAITGSNPSATQSTDAHSGNYAIRLESFDISDLFGGGGGGGPSIYGLLTNGNLPDENGFTGGFPYDKISHELNGWYKYTPTTGDTAMAIVAFSHWDAVGDSTVYNSFFGWHLMPAASYTYFQIPLNPDTTQPIDTCNIIFVPSNALFGGDTSRIPGSVLFLDDLWLESECDHVDTLSVFASDSAMDCDSYTILARDPGYVSWMWNDNSTGDSLAVTASGDYWVDVTDTAGCSLLDSIYVTITPCPGFEELDAKTWLKVFPNPTTGFVNFEFFLDESGETELSVVDFNGREVLRKHSMQYRGKYQGNFSLAGQAKGIYFVRLRANGRLYTGKTILR